MPYIAIKAYPRDEETKKVVAEKVNQVVMETLGCPAEAMSISVEYIKPEEWDEKVEQPEIAPNHENMIILDGVLQK